MVLRVQQAQEQPALQAQPVAQESQALQAQRVVVQRDQAVLAGPPDRAPQVLQALVEQRALVQLVHQDHKAQVA